jgi:hypothetical protein
MASLAIGILLHVQATGQVVRFPQVICQLHGQPNGGTEMARGLTDRFMHVLWVPFDAGV